MVGIKKKIYTYIAVFGIMALFFSHLVYTWANPSNHSFYYVIKDADDQYLIINGNSGVSDDGFMAAAAGNVAYDWVEIPEGGEFCSWQIIKVDPDVYYLPVPTEPDPDATPSDATPSDATPSDATPSDGTSSNATPSEATPPDATPSEVLPDATITAYNIFLKPGQRYPVSTLIGYANGQSQIAFRPVFHDQHVQLLDIYVVQNSYRRITYKLVFDHEVSYTGTLGTTVVADSVTTGGEVLLTVTKPSMTQSDHLVINAHYVCPRCEEKIFLAEEYVIQVPRFSAGDITVSPNDSDREEEQTPPEQPDIGTNGGGAGGTSGNQALEAKDNIMTIDCSSPERNGWYTTLPEVSIQAGEGYQVYYQIWNTSLGKTKEQAPVILYKGQLMFDDDGVYQCNIWAQKEGSDVRYNETSLEFKIDRTAPQISVIYSSGFEHGKYYSASQEMTIVIQEVNFSERNVEIIQDNGVVSGVWKHEGSRHSTTVLFEKEGLCSLDVKCTDLAGRYDQLPETQSFVIDTIAPLLKIEGIEDLTANKDAVIPVVTYSDENLDLLRTEITLESYERGEIRGNRKQSLENGSYVCTFAPIEEDDNYTLTARIYDKAGNLTEKTVRFSINQNGATFVFNKKEIVGTYTNESFYPAIEIWNVDEMTVVSLTLNGQDVDYDYEGGIVNFKNPIDKDGKYVINLEVKDTAGNLSVMKPIEFIFDQTKPVNIIQGVVDGGVYYAPVTIRIHTEQKDDIIKEIRINDQIVDDYEVDGNGTVILKILNPGEYKLSVISVDLAGNVSDTEAISFTYELSEDSKLSAQIFDQDIMGWCVIVLAAISVLIFGYKKRKTK